jgi:sporulation protein YlmC with PRC-barrel domain
MRGSRILNIAEDLKGMPVVDSESALVLGNTIDLIIKADEGRVLGLMVEALNGIEFSLESADYHIHHEIPVVLTSRSAIKSFDHFPQWSMSEVCKCTDLIGAGVETATGGVVGTIDQIYLVGDMFKILYKLNSSASIYFGREIIFLAGHFALRWAPDSRLMTIRDHSPSMSAAC